eukprot:5190441-Pyramimonas_sp.AAC.1
MLITLLVPLTSDAVVRSRGCPPAPLRCARGAPPSGGGGGGGAGAHLPDCERGAGAGGAVSAHPQGRGDVALRGV